MGSNHVYVHYGAKNFNPLLFKPIENNPWRNKPRGGLWASRVDAKFGWKDWCEQEEFADCKEDNSFKFSLLDSANIYHIYCREDVEQLPMQDSSGTSYWLIPDFEKLLQNGYDAIEFHLSEEKPTEDYLAGIYYALYGWDCDSIIVLNKAVIVPE